ncbi:MAG: class I SAM-dependent methyltransferase [Pseudomonadales bacterium]|nr:class I SAM-dependent methyltransferase [Pseudomonadales bacterium]
MGLVIDFIEQFIGELNGQAVSQGGSLLDSDCQRIFHGRGHTFEGLDFVTVDWYPPLIWITLFKDPGDSWLAEFRSQLLKLESLVAKHQISAHIQMRYLSGSPVEHVYGEPIKQLIVKEQGMQYAVKFGGQQNTGLFLDMAQGRQWVREHSAGANVLNLFSYTCAFSVAAIIGNARQVINLDMAKGALNWGRENHRLNHLPMDRVKFFAHDVLRSWGKMRKFAPYDLIIIDPPSFQKGSFVATKDYAKLPRRLNELISENGIVMTCLNAPELDSEFLKRLMAEHGFRFLERIDNPAVFKEIDPEKGLKVLLFEQGDEATNCI